jgi:HD-GYP domain-containing protein (c-di-GMP phosphodiesterase class II)
MDDRSVREKLLSAKVKTVNLPAWEVRSAPYTPLSISVLILGEKVTFSLYLKVAGKERQDFEFLPFLKEGEIWERRWLEGLTDKGLDRLYFHNDDLERMIACLNNYLQLLKHKSKKVSPELLTVFSEHLNFSLRRALQSPRLGPAVKEAQSQVENLVSWVQQDPRAIKLMWKILYHDYNLYNHSLNLCLMGVAFLLSLKYSATESRDLGLAALFHDIGMTRIPQEIIFKEGPLTPEERAEIKTHPEMGHQILKKKVGSALAFLPKEVLRLTLEHHENADGSGYPRGLPLNRQHPWTPIIRLLDSYDSLTVNRPYREAFKPFNSLKILKDAQGPRGPIYDPQTMKNFITFLTAD